LDRAAPKLESLIVEGAIPLIHHKDSEPSGNFMCSPNFLGGSAPLLQSIEFRDVLPDMLFAFPLPKLTKIDLVAPTAYVEFDEILNLVSTSPLLKDITVHAKVRLQDRSNKDKVTLCDLHYLDWKDFEGSTNLIPHLIAPNLKDLRIQVSQSTTLASILSPRQHEIGLFQIEPVEVDYYDGPEERFWCFHYHDYHEPRINGPLLVKVKGDVDLSSSNWSLSGLPMSLSGVKNLGMMLGEDAKGPVPLVEGLEHVKRITLVGKIDLLIPLIKPDDDKLVPFPHLSELRIDLTPSPSVLSALQTLTGVLDDRKRAGRPVNKLHLLSSRNQSEEITDSGIEEAAGEFIFTEGWEFPED
jgi:hypothetical protein